MTGSAWLIGGEQSQLESIMSEENPNNLLAVIGINLNGWLNHAIEHKPRREFFPTNNEARPPR
jgi:hypothetical protein